MKVSKFLTLAMAATALAVTSCKTPPPEVKVTSIAIPTTLEVSNVAPQVITATVTPADATTELTWVSSDPTIVTVVKSGKNQAIVTYVGAGTADITAKADNVTSNVCVVTSTFEAIYPDFPLEAGKTIVVAKLPSITCGAILTGVANKWDNKYNEGEQFMFVKINGFDGTWWKAEFDNSIIAGTGSTEFKIFCTLEDGTNPLGWMTGWQNATLISGDFTMPENGKDNAKLEIADANGGYVLYLEVGNWESSPCVPVQPAGTNITFVFTPCEGQTIDADATVIFTGNFTTNAWGDSDRAMTYANGKWSWTGDVPEGFMCKVIVNGKWMEDPNALWEGSNPFNFSACIQDWE